MINGLADFVVALGLGFVASCLIVDIIVFTVKKIDTLKRPRSNI